MGAFILRTGLWGIDYHFIVVGNPVGMILGVAETGDLLLHRTISCLISIRGYLQRLTCALFSLACPADCSHNSIVQRFLSVW